MGRLLLKDFENQKKYILGILLLAIPAAAVGFAFRMIYDCVGIILTAGMIIIYFNCFFEFHKTYILTRNDEEERLLKILREKMKVRTKYVEILLLAAISYVIMSIAFVIDGYDTGLFGQADYLLNDSIEKIAFYPLIFMVTTAFFSPFLTAKKTGRGLFIVLAVFSILIPYGIFLLNFFISFVDMIQVMIPVLIIVPAVTLISYFISMTIVIRKR